MRFLDLMGPLFLLPVLTIPACGKSEVSPNDAARDSARDTMSDQGKDDAVSIRVSDLF